MAATIQQMREAVDQLHEHNKTKLEFAKSQDRVLNEDEQKVFDKNVEEIRKLKQQIKNEELLIETQPKWEDQKQVSRVHPSDLATTPTGIQVKNIAAAIPKHLRLKQLEAFKGDMAAERAYRAGKFYLATLYGSHDAQDWCDRNGIKWNDRGRQSLAMAENVNSAGGFLVPEEFEQSIIDLREDYGVFRQNARVVPMASDTRVVPRKSTRLTAYYVDENPASAITQSAATFDMVRLTAKKLATLTLYSSEIGEDAIVSLGDDITRDIALAFANAEDEAGFNGDGTSTYGGIMGLKNVLAAGSTPAITTGATHTSFGTLTLTDFHIITGTLPEYARAGAKWFISSVGFANSMERLAYAGGGNTIGNIQDGSSRQFLGYPVVISQVLLASTGASTSTIFGYFGNMTMSSTFGSRRGVTVAMSDQRYFEFDQIGIRGTQRYDIANHETGTASVAGAILAMKFPAS